MRGSGLKYDNGNGWGLAVPGYMHLLMVLTLDYGVARHFLNKATFFVRVEVEVEGIYGRDEKKYIAE